MAFPRRATWEDGGEVSFLLFALQAAECPKCGTVFAPDAHACHRHLDLGNHMGIISGSFDRLKIINGAWHGAQRHHRSLWLRFRCGRPRSSSYRCICGNCYAPDSNFCRRLGLGLKKRWLDSPKIEKPHWQFWMGKPRREPLDLKVPQINPWDGHCSGAGFDDPLRLGIQRCWILFNGLIEQSNIVKVDLHDLNE